jgi:predicted nucleotidyltransferase
MLIEGYYLRLRDESIWSVKGCCSCDRGVVAIPRYAGGRKIKGYAEALNIVREFYPRFLYRPRFTTYSIPVVSFDEIKDVIKPSEEIRCYLEDKYSRHVELANEFLDVLKSQVSGDIKFYVTGSMLYCVLDDESDLDLIVYDPDDRYFKLINKLISDGVLSHLGVADFGSMVVEGLDYRSHSYLLARSIHEVKYRDLKVTFRFVKCDSLVNSIVCGEKTGERVFEGYVSILNDSRGMYTPSIYKAVAVDVADNEHRFIYAYSHRIRYASLDTDMTLYCSTYLEILKDGLEVINLDRGSCSLVAW